MARKVINCAPVTEIEIITAEGERTLLRFDILALQELQSMAGSLTEAAEQGVGELAALILYAAGKHQDETMTLEKARRMVVCMHPQNVNDIVDEFAESMGTVIKEEQREAAKKAMAQFLEGIMK